MHFFYPVEKTLMFWVKSKTTINKTGTSVKDLELGVQYLVATGSECSWMDLMPHVCLFETPETTPSNLNWMNHPSMLGSKNGATLSQLINHVAYELSHFGGTNHQRFDRSADVAEIYTHRAASSVLHQHLSTLRTYLQQVVIWIDISHMIFIT